MYPNVAITVCRCMCVCVSIVTNASLKKLFRLPVTGWLTGMAGLHVEAKSHLIPIYKHILHIYLNMYIYRRPDKETSPYTLYV